MSSSPDTSFVSTSESSSNSNANKKRKKDRVRRLFSFFLFRIVARNLERDDLGRVSPTNCFIRHMEYSEFQTGIFGRMESAQYNVYVSLTLHQMLMWLSGVCGCVSESCGGTKDFFYFFFQTQRSPSDEKSSEAALIDLGLAYWSPKLSQVSDRITKLK